ncbi:MAG TPA: hypothetical protein DCQ35_00010 [Rhodospirillum rubrum]|nr:hypothetical protein [Rhodospirillum rubrum]HCF17361.1 hypothetical protein [Rhodospirillum rubrum]
MERRTAVNLKRLLWLGRAVIPNSVWAFDRPRPGPSAKLRWCARNDGLCMKNMEKAANPMSAIV